MGMFIYWTVLQQWVSYLLFSTVRSDSLWPHGLQHSRLPCLSPSPRACSNSCPLSQWCHLTISSSIVPFSSLLQSFPVSGSFLMSQLFTSDRQSIGASAPASFLPMNIQDWFPLGLTGLIFQELASSNWHFSRTTIFLRLVDIQSCSLPPPPAVLMFSNSWSFSTI